MNRIARELALDVGDGAYFPEVVRHIPGIANGLADKLSRACAPSETPWQVPPEVSTARRDETIARYRQWWRSITQAPVKHQSE